MDYKAAYSVLWNAMTDAINILGENKDDSETLIRKIVNAMTKLKLAQLKTEEMYIESEDESDTGE